MGRQLIHVVFSHFLVEIQTTWNQVHCDIVLPSNIYIPPAVQMHIIPHTLHYISLPDHCLPLIPSQFLSPNVSIPLLPASTEESQPGQRHRLHHRGGSHRHRGWCLSSAGRDCGLMAGMVKRGGNANRDFHVLYVLMWMYNKFSQRCDMCEGTR